VTTDYGIKVTEAGYDVASADIENIIFSSSYPFFKVYSDSTSSLTIPANATSATIIFSHSLGYVPAFTMYSTVYTDDTYSRQIPRGVSPQPVFSSAYATTSSVVFLIKLDGSAPEFSITLRCIIFKDRIS